jgi:hypothetical protein
MNIFILDEDVEKNVSYYVDKHIIKMILETSQLLCSVHHLNGNKAPYKLTHKNHPCTKWSRESLSNYRWLCNLGKQLCKEYTYRFKKIHKSQNIIEWCINNKPNIKDSGLTSFVQAMPQQYKNNNCIVAYRNYYINEKQHLYKWTNRKKPYWINNNEE